MHKNVFVIRSLCTNHSLFYYTHILSTYLTLPITDKKQYHAASLFWREEEGWSFGEGRGTLVLANQRRASEQVLRGTKTINKYNNDVAFGLIKTSGAKNIQRSLSPSPSLCLCVPMCLPCSAAAAAVSIPSSNHRPSHVPRSETRKRRPPTANRCDLRFMSPGCLDGRATRREKKTNFWLRRALDGHSFV